MRHFLFIVCMVMASPLLSQSLTQQQKEFCVETFRKYLHVDENLIQQRIDFLKSLDNSPEDIAWYRQNITRMDSVMNAAISYIGKDNLTNLAGLFEKERYNIYAHPHNDTYLCYDLHSVMALIYSKVIDGDREYYTILADMAEFSRLMIETVQANWDEPHPLYLKVLDELKQIYRILNNPDKIKEIDSLLDKKS